MKLKSIVLALSICIPGLSMADCRLNEQDGNRKFHGPYSDKTDIESRTGNFKANSFPPGDADSRFAYATTTLRYGCGSWGPDELAPMNVGNFISITHSTTGETCAYTDTDGNALTMPYWGVKTTKVEEVPVRPYNGFGPRAYCYYEQTMLIYGVPLQ